MLATSALRTIALLMLAASPARSAAPSATLPEAVVAAGYTRQTFGEEFDALDLSPDRRGAHRWYNGLWYKPPTSPNDAFSVRQGVLTANAAPGRLGAQLTSFSADGRSTLFGYGYFEARMRWDVNVFGGATFWLLSERATWRTTRGKFTRYCEFDVVEPFKGTKYHFAIHDFYMPKKSYEKPGVARTSTVPIDADAWHRYGILWQPGTITLFLDGKPVYEMPEPEACVGKKMFLIFGAQKGKPEGEQRAYYDWIRVYSKAAPAR